MAIQVDHIEIDGHKRKEYSEEEKVELRFKFILTLHSLLIVYLALHNLLIPLVINIARGNFILTDVHFWFLIHFPLHFTLRTFSRIDPTLFSAIGVGVIVRVAVEMMLVTKLKSWGMLSIYISEIATLIFVVAGYSTYKPKFRMQGMILALIAIPLFSYIEVRSDWSKASIVREKPQIVIDNSAGCEGSLIEFSSQSLILSSLEEGVRITSCGLSHKMTKVSENFRLKNTRSSRVNIRLFKLHITDHTPRWRFLRLYVLAPNEELVLTQTELAKERLFLLKSPEMKELGQTLIINQNRVNEIPKGQYRLDSVSIHFSEEK